MVNKIILAQLLAVLATSVMTAPQDPNPQSIQLLRYENSITEDGYQFEYSLSDGTLRRETGTNDGGILSVSGSYEFIAPDGTKYIVEYTADENGYRPLFKKLEVATALKDVVSYFPMFPIMRQFNVIDNLRHASEDLQLSLIGGGLKHRFRKGRITKDS